VAYDNLKYTDDGLFLDSRSCKSLFSKLISYSSTFDVRITYSIIDFSVHRSWIVKFKYVFISGNYIEYILKYDKTSIYVAYKYYYNGYSFVSTDLYFPVDTYSIKFWGSFEGYVGIDYGHKDNWSNLWTSSQHLFVETTGRLQIFLESTDWDSWVVIALSDFYNSLYIDNVTGDIDFFEGKPLLRDYYYVDISEYNTYILLPNCVTTSIFSSEHMSFFVSNDVNASCYVDTYNHVFELVAYSAFTYECCIYITGEGDKLFNYYPSSI
jgi:hypothetical protein